MFVFRIPILTPQKDHIFHLLKSILFFPLLLLKGVDHYWENMFSFVFF